MNSKRDNSGAIFKNEKKEKPEHADYNGDAVVAGVSYFINAWINEYTDKNGETRKYLGIKFKQKETRQPNLVKEKKKELEDELEDIPF